MNAKKIQKFKEILLEEKQKTLEGLLNENENYESLKEEVDGDIADVAFQSYEKQLLIGLSQKEKQKLEAIDAALKRVEEGTYGVCVDCGCEVEEKRLMALPWALRCVKCMSKYEDEKKKRG